MKKSDMIVPLKNRLAKIKEKTAFSLATWFGAGLAPKAPGTAGSFAALPLAFFASLAGGIGIVVATLILFWVGCKVSAVVLKSAHEPDPGYIVIDEVAGQTFTFFLVAPFLYDHPLYFLLGFAFFRFFDIVKVWPASFFDKKVHTAFGLMADDVAAGFYASLCLTACHLIF